MVVIESATFGEVKIDRKIYYSDMIVWWTGEKEFRLKSDIFGMKEFRKILEKEPEIIVVGTGIVGILQVAPEVEHLAEQKKIQIFVETSPKAAEMFNGFIANKKHAVAIIHTTG